MSVFLRQSTAVDVAIGPFLDATDGVTAETALTIAQADVRLKKNNGAWAQVNDATSATHEENGWYEKELDATDTNTVGRLLIAVHESGALPVWHEFWVLEEVVYDALFAASAAGYGTAQTGDSFARLGAPAGASIAADIATVDDFVDTEVTAIKNKTDNLPADPADASDIAAAIAALNDLSAAEVNAEVVDALATDTYGEPTGVPGATVSFATKVGYLYMALRNGLTLTSTKKQFLDDGGAAEWEKDLSDDGTTYTESEGNAP